MCWGSCCPLRRLSGRRGGLGRGIGAGKQRCPLWDKIRGVWNQGVTGVHLRCVHTFIPARPRCRTRRPVPGPNAADHHGQERGRGAARRTCGNGRAPRPPVNRAIPARPHTRLQAIALTGGRSRARRPQRCPCPGHGAGTGATAGDRCTNALTGGRSRARRPQRCPCPGHGAGTGATAGDRRTNALTGGQSRARRPQRCPCPGHGAGTGATAGDRRANALTGGRSRARRPQRCPCRGHGAGPGATAGDRRTHAVRYAVIRAGQRGFGPVPASRWSQAQRFLANGLPRRHATLAVRCGWQTSKTRPVARARQQPARLT
jgi:hypothetical protein